MPEVIIYTKESCPYCTEAKALFNKKGIKYKEIDVSNNDDERGKLVKKANGRTTFPQIFIDGKHIGGCDDLYQFDKDGKL